MWNEILLYLALTAGTFGAGRAGGIPWDPDRTFQFAGAGCQQTTAIPTLGAIQLCDKLAHALGGAQLTVVFVAIERRSGKESCGRTVLRAALRTQLASAVYEVGAALAHRRHWGQPGHGLGLLDHAALTIGSGAAAGAICGIRSVLR